MGLSIFPSQVSGSSRTASSPSLPARSLCRISRANNQSIHRPPYVNQAIGTAMRQGANGHSPRSKTFRISRCSVRGSDEQHTRYFSGYARPSDGETSNNRAVVRCSKSLEGLAACRFDKSQSFRCGKGVAHAASRVPEQPRWGASLHDSALRECNIGPLTGAVGLNVCERIDKNPTKPKGPNGLAGRVPESDADRPGVILFGDQRFRSPFALPPSQA